MNVFDWIMESCVCPKCKKIFYASNDYYIYCINCNIEYPIVKGIPVIVPNPIRHLSSIEVKSVEKPGWYTGDQTAYQDTGPYRDHLRKRREYVISVLSPLKGKLLDFGCGDGHNLRWLQTLGFDIYATDYNMNRLLRAKSVFMEDIKILLSDINSAVFYDNFFDAVFLNHVIEHIKDDEQALKNIHSITKHGGCVVLGTPNEGSAWWQLAYKLEPASLENTDHVHFYTADAIKNKCIQAGFVVDEIKYLGYGLPHWSADSIFRNIPGIDDMMDQIGERFFKDQASSLYLVLRKP